MRDDSEDQLPGLLIDSVTMRRSPEVRRLEPRWFGQQVLLAVAVGLPDLPAPAVRDGAGEAVSRFLHRQRD